MNNNKIGFAAIAVVAAVGLFIYHKSMVKKDKPIIKKPNVVKPDVKVEPTKPQEPIQEIISPKDSIIESLDSSDIIKSIEEFEAKILQEERRAMANTIYKFIGNLYMENELAKNSDDGIIIEEVITRVVFVDELPEDNLTFEFEEIFEF